MYPYQKTDTIRCSGDMGDIIYLLNFMKVLGSKKLYLDPSGGSSYTLPNGLMNIKCKFNQKSYDFLLPFLETQKYISVEKFSNQEYDVYINEFFQKDLKILNLNLFHAIKFSLELSNLNKPWIDLEKNNKSERPIAINRSLRYRNNDTFYYYNLNLLKKSAIFVGIEEEYLDFKNKFKCDIPYIKTNNCLELANVINSCDTFFGNGSLACSLAIGLGLNVYYEFCPQAANYLFKRHNLIIF